MKDPRIAYYRRYGKMFPHVVFFFVPITQQREPDVGKAVNLAPFFGKIAKTEDHLIFLNIFDTSANSIATENV